MVLILVMTDNTLIPYQRPLYKKKKNKEGGREGGLTAPGIKTAAASGSEFHMRCIW